MEEKDPTELIREVQSEQQQRRERAVSALEWFLDGRVGEFYPRDEVAETLSAVLDVETPVADTAIADVVGDVVDPVQQVVKDRSRYVGILDYRVFEDAGAYGYVDFDDRKGKRKRVVCARCVEKHDYDELVRHATQGEGTVPPDATWDALVDVVTDHYTEAHTHPPDQIEPGASLVNGTTVGGNTAYHTGNLADRGAVNFTPSTNNQTIPEGYHNGNGTVEGDADLAGGNIKNGVSIFGVTGSLDTNYTTTVTDGTGTTIDTFSQGGDETYQVNTSVNEGPTKTITVIGRATTDSQGESEDTTFTYTAPPNLNGDADYTFNGSASFRRILVNGTEVENKDSPDTGTISVSTGDEVKLRQGINFGNSGGQTVETLVTFNMFSNPTASIDGVFQV